MHMKLVLPLILLLSSSCHAEPRQCFKQVRIAIIDTGLDINDPRFKDHLCPTGHKNFVKGVDLYDTNDHGTHIAGLIKEYAGKARYCMLIYKYYERSSEDLNANREILALQEAVKNGANVVNISGGGSEFSEDEYIIMRDHPEITFVVAAGNDHRNIDIPGNEYFPASYFLPNIVVVENISDNGNLSKSSNWSSRAVKEHGENVLSTIPCRQEIDGKLHCTSYMTGTSQATAIASGKLLAKMSKSCEYR